MIDEAYRAQPQFSSVEQIAAWYSRVQQQAADNVARPKDPYDQLYETLRGIALDRLRGEMPDEDWMVHFELAGDIAKDIRNWIRSQAE